MTEQEFKSRATNIVTLAAGFCGTLENAREMEKETFIASMLDYLPRLYWEFGSIPADMVPESDEFGYLASKVDEDYYESIRRNVGLLLGPDDTFLETFEEDMKYSDTPIAASVSEGLADIFQDLFDFVANVRESEGALLAEAFRQCRENFEMYWSQTLCNVMRPLNQLRYPGR